MAPAELFVPLRFAIDQGVQTKALNEPLQFTFGDRSLGEIDEVSADAAFRKEAKRLAGFGALFHAEDLDFHA